MDTYFWINTKYSSAKYNGSYSIQLPRRITLTDKHEIGLHEVIYPTYLKTLPREDDCIICITYRHEDNTLNETFKIPWKNYNSIIQLIETINDFLLEFTEEIKFDVDQDSVIVNSHGGTIALSKSLMKIFGLKHQFFSYEKAYSIVKPDILKYNHFLNLCLDVIEPQFVSNIWIPLLRKVYHDKDTEHAHTHKTFLLPLYFSIAKNDFDVITVSIVDDKNRNINFDESEGLSLLLHIRKKKM